MKEKIDNTWIKKKVRTPAGERTINKFEVQKYFVKNIYQGW